MDYKSHIKNLIAEKVTKYLRGKRKKTAHVLDHIFPQERKVRSLIGGLETSFGTQFWEQLCKDLAINNGFVVCNEKAFNKCVPIIPNKIRTQLDSFIYEKSKNPLLEISSFVNNTLKTQILNGKINVKEFGKIPKGEGVDIWLIKDNIEFLIDIKTNQINAKDGEGLTKTIVYWQAYNLLNHSEQKDFQTRSLIAFPFNPHSPKSFWSMEKGKVQPLIPSEEALVDNEFWELISGLENTTEIIFSAFKELGDQEFGNQFHDIFYSR